MEIGYADRKRAASNERTDGVMEGVADRRAVSKERTYGVEGKHLDRRRTMFIERTGGTEKRLTGRRRNNRSREITQKETIRKLDRNSDNCSEGKCVESRNGDTLRTADKNASGRKFDDLKNCNVNGLSSSVSQSNSSVYPEKRLHVSRSRTPRRENERRQGVAAPPGSLEECESGVIV